MQSARTTPRRRSRAVLALGAALFAVATGVLAPSPAGATPTVAEASERVRKAAQELTFVDEQLHEAELIVAEQRKAAAAAAKQAAAARKARAELKGELKSGKLTLEQVLKREDDTVGKMKVSVVLESLPGVGKVKARKIMEDVGIADNRRVQGLGSQQRQSLLEAVPPKRA